MRDIFGDGVLGANIGDTNVRGLSGFAQCVVARIEVLPFLSSMEIRMWPTLVKAIRSTHLQFVLEEVLLCGHFAIQAQQALLVRAQRL